MEKYFDGVFIFNGVNRYFVLKKIEFEKFYEFLVFIFCERCKEYIKYRERIFEDFIL